MRSCEHARRAPSADPAAQSQHAGHVSALGEAQLVVERAGALVLDVHVELYLLGLGLGSDHRMRSGVVIVCECVTNTLPTTCMPMTVAHAMRS